jgi:protein TonB
MTMIRTLLVATLLAGCTALSANAQTAPKTAGQPADSATAAKQKTYKATIPPKKVIPIADFYEGGQEALYNFIDSQANYPAMARRNRIQGECIIGITLNPDGTMTNLKIIRNASAGLGDEALRIVKLLKFNAPGYAAQYSLPVIFKL